MNFIIKLYKNFFNHFIIIEQNNSALYTKFLGSFKNNIKK